MAGIGFELRKLFTERSLLTNIKASIYSTIIISGPMIICILTITVLQFGLKTLNTSPNEIELFTGAVVYSCVFSLLITSGISIILTRYVSDLLYEEKYDDILSSLYGALSLCLIIGAATGLSFYYFSPLKPDFKFLAYVLYIVMLEIWVVSVYLSALKNYKRILTGFLIGSIIMISAAVILSRFEKYNNAYGFLLAMDLGFFIILLVFINSVRDYFKVFCSNIFKFLSYFDKYPLLFFAHFFFTLGLNIHNIIFWLSRTGTTIANTYRLAPFYDVPTYYAFLTTIPSVVIFVVRFETSFLGAYKKYYSSINKGGKWVDIQKAKREMFFTLKDELRFLICVQLILSLGFFLLGLVLLPFLSLTADSIKIFTIQVFSCYLYSILLVLLHIHYYFTDYKGALGVSIVFLFTNIAFTIMSLRWGESYYGFGMLTASLLGLHAAATRLHLYLRKLDHITYCSQPLSSKENNGIFTWLYSKSEMFFRD